jgi:DNA-binding MarR family transcriptional regulator
MSGEFVLREAAAALMRQAVHAISKDIDGRLREHGLTLVQRRALALLSERQAVTPGGLSLALDVDTGATTRLLDRLVAKGMCRRYRGNGDRRQVQLEVTELGLSALEMTQGIVSGVQVEWFSRVAGNELEIVRHVLSTILAAGR